MVGFRLAALPVLILACRKNPDEGRVHVTWKPERATKLVVSGASMPIPAGFRNVSEIVEDDVRNAAASMSPGDGWLVTEDLHHVLTLHWGPSTEPDICSTLKVGVDTEFGAVETIDTLPEHACRITRRGAATFYRVRGDRTLAFSCTFDDARCTTTYASIALP